ncbi:hypothetical protein VCHENC02_5728A, partial [Vibrio harveyi]
MYGIVQRSPLLF